MKVDKRLLKDNFKIMILQFSKHSQSTFYKSFDILILNLFRGAILNSKVPFWSEANHRGHQKLLELTCSKRINVRGL